MKFTIHQSILKPALARLSAIIEKKATIPVLSSLLIESLSETRLRLTATDLDTTLVLELDAAIAETGSMCVSGKKLYSIANLLPEQDVSIETEDNHWAKLKCAASNYRIAGHSSEQFPAVPVLKASGTTFPAIMFFDFIKKTSFAITREQSRFTLSGAKFMVGDGKASMVTTDGHRLCYIAKECDAQEGRAFDVIIPHKALTQLSAIASEDVQAEIVFADDPNHIYATVGNCTLISRKLTGAFPNWEMVIPKQLKGSFTCKLDDLNLALKRVVQMADERTKSMRFVLENDTLTLKAQAAEEGESLEAIPVEYQGEEVEFGFNAQYISDFLNVVGFYDPETGKIEQTDYQIRFEFKDGTTQTKLSILDNETSEFFYIAMPLRI